MPSTETAVRIIRWCTGEPRQRSAAEIVAGAIQDHDRGLIAGETTSAKAWFKPSTTI